MNSPTDQEREANCPCCKRAFPWDIKSPWRPFCSERCKLIDLGDWLDERNRIPDDSGHRPFTKAGD